jgi:two-component system CheB/CheR fusion protein
VPSSSWPLNTTPTTRAPKVSAALDPSAQIVLDAAGAVLIANTRARELFGLTSKDIGRPLQDLAMSYKPIELRSCIDDAHGRRQVVQGREVAWPTTGGDSWFFNVQVADPR